MRLMRWFHPILIALAFIAAMAGAACGGDSGEKVSNELSPNQELRLRIAGDPSTLDPQLALYAEDISVVKQLFRGLFTYDQDLNVIPAVALAVPSKENGGISEDGLTYTINLRPDATWSDGASVTAEDFVYAFQRLFDPEAGAQGYYFDFYTSIAGAAEFAYDEGGSADEIGVTAIDSDTLRITLAEPKPTLPALLALWPAVPLREDVIDQYGDDWTQPGNLIGNGPFVLADYVPEDEIVLRANPSYWGNDKPTLQTLVYRIIPDDSAALIAYENREIDMTSIPAPDASRFEGDDEQLRFAQLETYAIQYNTKEAPFDDPLVRQAISRAIDRGAYVRVVRGGVGTPALGWLPPGMPGADASVGQDLGYDPDAARELLDEAGYADGDGFPTFTFTIVDDETNRTTAEFLQEQLRINLGINMRIETVEEGAYYDRYQEGDFQVTWSSWFADYADPENWLPQQFGTDGALNVLGYSNPAVDELFASAATELDQQARLALYDQAHHMIIEDDQAVTPVFYPDTNYLVKRNVADLVTTALDASPGDWFTTSVRILQTGNAAPPASNP